MQFCLSSYQECVLCLYCLQFEFFSYLLEEMELSVQQCSLQL